MFTCKYVNYTLHLQQIDQNLHAMTKNMLLPRGFKRAGWAILIPTLLLGVYVALHDMNTSSLTDLAACILHARPDAFDALDKWLTDLIIIGILVGSIFVTCSRERVEDELIARIRLNALLLALYADFALLIGATLSFYDLQYLNILIYNLFTLPFLFLVLYELSLWRLKKSLGNEE